MTRLEAMRVFSAYTATPGVMCVCTDNFDAEDSADAPTIADVLAALGRDLPPGYTAVHDGDTIYVREHPTARQNCKIQ
jgi:hypothetical protein